MVLILAFSINSIGIAVVFQYQKYLIRTQFKDYLKSSCTSENLIKIAVPKVNNTGTAIYKTDDDEFSYDSRMYDVVKTMEIGDSISYYCINDEKEEQLLKSYSEHLHNTNNDNDLINRLLVKMLNSISFYNKNVAPTNTAEFQMIHILTFNQNMNYSAFLEILTPPPEDLHYS